MADGTSHSAALAEREPGPSPEAERVAPRPLPTRLDSAQAKLVYLYLSQVPEAEVSEVKAALGLDLLSLYPVLDTLVREGLVERDGAVHRIQSPVRAGD